MSKKTTNKKSEGPSNSPGSIPVKVAVFESGRSNQKRASEVVLKLGYQLSEANTEMAICSELAGPNPPDVVVVGLPGGEGLVSDALARGSDRPVLVAAVAGPAASATERADRADCDLFVVRPLAEGNLASILSAANRLSQARGQARAARGTEERLRERLKQYGSADINTGLQHIDFFKNFLVMELKRAKRYGYSLAACLVAIDPWPEDSKEPSPSAARELRRLVAAAITSAMRDIDLPVDYAEDRFLAFLPYTDLDGAERVGRRIAAAVKSAGKIEDAGTTIRMSVSVGIAALREGQPISFSRLIRDASMAVRAAQLKGGGRVIVRG